MIVDGDVYICGCSEDYTQNLPNSGNEVSVNETSCDRLRRIAIQVSSKLENINVDTKQACYLPQSQDGNPVIGRLYGLNNIYIATVKSFNLIFHIEILSTDNLGS